MIEVARWFWNDKDFMHSDSGAIYTFSPSSVPGWVSISDYDFLAAENAKLRAQAKELNTYAGHTWGCIAHGTGDHAECTCGYNEAAKFLEEKENDPIV